VPAVVVLAAAGWLAYAHWWAGGDEHPVAWRDLTPRLGKVEFTRKVTAVYRSRAAFENLLEATMPGRAPQPPSVDWNRDEVLVVALGPRSSTGYSLQIRRVVERRHGIDVYARERTPSLGEAVTARVTYPYRALAMRRSDKRISVKLQGRP
jgi:hypothetical protein